MFGRTGKRDGAAQAAPQAAAPLPPHRRDATDGFPRGLPDGDPNKPGALGRWPSSAEVASMLPAWRPGMFLLGRDGDGRYYGHADDRHVLSGEVLAGLDTRLDTPPSQAAVTQIPA